MSVKWIVLLQVRPFLSCVISTAMSVNWIVLLPVCPSLSCFSLIAMPGNWIVLLPVLPSLSCITPITMSANWIVLLLMWNVIMLGLWPRTSGIWVTRYQTNNQGSNGAIWQSFVKIFRYESQNLEGDYRTVMDHGPPVDFICYDRHVLFYMIHGHKNSHESFGCRIPTWLLRGQVASVARPQ